MSDRVVWGGFTQSALDAAYNNMAAVADSAVRLEAWTARSAAFRTATPGEREVAYGPRPRNRIDLFRCGRIGAPLMVYIHGGWWQRNSKETFSCLAAGPLARGLDVAMVGYTLAPEATLTAIVAEIQAALDGLAALQAERGDERRLLLAGWSAGGHLTAQCLAHPAVGAGLSISGVFDLAPIRASYINDKLNLTEAEVAALSPLHGPVPEKPLALAYGLAELPELQRQSGAMLARLVSAGCVGRALPLRDHDHFSILDAMEAPDGALTEMAVALAQVL